MKKKFSSLFVLWTIMISIVSAQDAKGTVYVDNAIVKSGSIIELPIKIQSDIDIAGFMFTMSLPEGISVASDLTVSSNRLPEGAETKHFLATEKIDNGIYTVAGGLNYAIDNVLQSFTGRDGEIAIVTLSVADDIQLGDYSIHITDAGITTVDGTDYDANGSFFTLTVKENSYDAGYSVQIAPFEFNEDVDGLEFVLNSQKDLINVSFDVELPENIGNNQLYTITKALGNTTAATSIDDDEAGSVSVSIARKSTKTIKNGNTVAKLELGYDGDVLSAGIYPLVIKNVKMTDTDGNEYDAAPVTSYIKIGNPANASLSLSGLVTSDVNDAMAEETAITSLDMSNVTAIDGTLSLVDRRSYVAPKRAVDAEKVEYVRSMSNSFGTVCVPFDIASDETIQLYQLKNVTDNTMTFEPVANVSAGTPTVFKLLSGSQADFVAENVTITAGEESCDCTIDGESWTMNGTYANMNLDPAACSNDIYYISENKFVYGNMAFDVATYRAWFETPKSAAGTKVFNIEIDDAEATGVKYVEKADGTVDVVFDLSGNKLPSAKNGINIINGKKVFVK